MDGWESRRHNTSAFDWVIVRLGAPGFIHAVDIDTRHFNGNQPLRATLEACSLNSAAEEKEAVQVDFPGWKPLVSDVHLGPNAHHGFLLLTEKQHHPQVYSHLRLKIYPDGGVARLRVYGTVQPKFDPSKRVIDVASAVYGAHVMSFSNQHFGKASQLLLPTRGDTMADGWETARSREKDHADWVVVRLSSAGGEHGVHLERIDIDTGHFKGNFPTEADVYACKWSGDQDPSKDPNCAWFQVLSPQKLSGDKVHTFSDLSCKDMAFTHVKLTIRPDGGVKRLRVFGHKANPPPAPVEVKEASDAVESVKTSDAAKKEVTAAVPSTPSNKKKRTLDEDMPRAPATAPHVSTAHLPMSSMKKEAPGTSKKHRHGTKA